MITADERMKVLEMIRQGKLSPEAAAQLLQAMESDQPQPAASVERQSEVVSQRAAGNGKWLHVRVTDTDSGRPRVNVRLPLKLVNLGMKLGARYAPEIEGIDIAALLEAAQLGEAGPFVDVYDEDDGEHVEVFIE